MQRGACCSGSGRTHSGSRCIEAMASTCAPCRHVHANRRATTSAGSVALEPHCASRRGLRCASPPFAIRSGEDHQCLPVGPLGGGAGRSCATRPRARAAGHRRGLKRGSLASCAWLPAPTLLYACLPATEGSWGVLSGRLACCDSTPPLVGMLMQPRWTLWPRPSVSTGLRTDRRS